ncbi:MAG: HAD family phosphatase [Clostridiales bacterium]|nr:HAD family phosphatase [Clostridiales bacterium]
MDGTLVDSMWMWHDIDVEYLAQYGCSCPPMLQREIEGMSFTETAVYFKERFAIPDLLDEIKASWVRMSLDKYRHEVPLKKGAARFLRYLKSKGIRTGIATSNGSDMVQAVLEAQGVAGDFDCVVTACEVAHGKPAPDIYLKVASDLGVEPQDCLVFEDIPAGIRAGKAADMTVCAVEDDHSAWLRAEKIALADYYVKDYEEFFAELQ